jgi:hypothetical protein
VRGDRRSEGRGQRAEGRGQRDREQRSDSAEKFIELVVGADPDLLDDITLAIADCADV